jgi:hypothetical protein
MRDDAVLATQCRFDPRSIDGYGETVASDGEAIRGGMACTHTGS